MLNAYSNIHRPPASRYHVSLAIDDAEIHEAQRLRYQVFAEEMGARLSSREPGLDTDLYDPHCDHMLVRDRVNGAVVGAYRILPPEAAKRVGGYYSEQQFDLARLDVLRPRMAELGRSCVHRDHRNGAVIARLWAGLAGYMTRYGYEHVIGCAHFGMSDGGHNAASVSPAGGVARYGRVRAATPAAQGLHAPGRHGLRRACMGSGLQHRRSADAAADVAVQPRRCATFN
jgi:putative hemolysin